MAGVELHLVGQAQKRGLIPRLPTPATLTENLERWLRTEANDTLRRVRRRADPETGAAVLGISLHPAAEEVLLLLGEAGRIELSASTAEAGPGYHTFLCHLARRLAEELSIDWAPSTAEESSVDETGYFDTGTRADVERTHLVWLRGLLERARAERDRRGGPVAIASFDGHRFTPDAPVVTALGPRSDRWLADAVERPRLAADVWPWMADAMDARYLLNRALSIIWTEVRWRAPATPDERAVLDEVLRLLRSAFPLEPTLPYPWREWREILQLAGAAADPMSERVVREAESAPDGPLAGYRRDDVTVVHAGWELTVPGSFAETRTDEEWSGSAAGRTVTLAAVETGEGGEPMAARTFLDRVAGHLGRDALTHEDGPILGRARLGVDASSGVEVAFVDGYSAVLGSGAAIRVEIDDPDDWEWALGMWRSLAPARERPT